MIYFINRILNKSVKWRLRHYIWNRYKFKIKYRKVLKAMKQHNKNIDPDKLSNRQIALRYSDNKIMIIQYPPNCCYFKHEELDYCWGLALAFEQGKEEVEKFYAHCPCERL